MSKIVDELKAEHILLSEKLQKAKENGCFTPEAREYIFEIEEDFKKHLKKEDEQLYVAFHEAAKTDSSIKSLMDNFAKELQSVTDDVINFFEKHEKDSNHEDFEKDIVHLISSVEARITKEEHILYPKYEQLMG